jgi:hypothetical protein
MGQLKTLPGSFDSAPQALCHSNPSVRGSAQDDDFVGGEYNWLNMEKTRKIEKVTGSQEDDFVGGVNTTD